MLINLRNAMMTGKRLPYLCELEYLESTGTQWINTGVKFATDNARVKFTASVTYASDKMLCGSQNHSVENNYGFICYLYSNAMRFYIGSANTGSISSLVDGNVHTVDLQANSGTLTKIIDGATSTASYRGTIVSGEDFTIFTSWKVSSSSMEVRCVGAKIYTFQIWDNGVLVRDLIPVLSYDYEACLYDRVTRTFYRNAGTGEFVAGPRKGWVNPYVTDGLVAMWDGEWNFVGGVNRQDSTTCINLVNGDKNNLPSNTVGTVSATSDAYRCTITNTGTFVFNVTSPAATTNNTVESVWHIVSLPNAPSGNCYPVQFLGGLSRIPTINSNGDQYLYWGGVAQPSLSVNAVGGAQKMAASITSDSNNGTVFYKNGSSLRSYSSASAPSSGNNAFFYAPNTTAWPTGTVMDLHSVRVYSRALTASEIAANYAVDKVRFGLP